MPQPLMDLTGQTFGRLTAVRRAEFPKQPTRWECECSCGTRKLIRADCLRRGVTVSCGCWNREQKIKHGAAFVGKKKPEYRIWKGMVGRCTSPGTTGYKDYGGRGIDVCAEWRESFQAFFDHVGKRPSSKHSLDRIDNNGNYEPGNVRWATPIEQARNKRTARFITHNGITKTLPEWAEDIGIMPATLRCRLKHGWPVERALTRYGDVGK